VAVLGDLQEFHRPLAATQQQLRHLDRGSRGDAFGHRQAQADLLEVEEGRDHAGLVARVEVERGLDFGGVDVVLDLDLARRARHQVVGQQVPRRGFAGGVLGVVGELVGVLVPVGAARDQKARERSQRARPPPHATAPTGFVAEKGVSAVTPASSKVAIAADIGRCQK
jgi:hypothetical protein